MATSDSFAQGWNHWFRMIGPAAQSTSDALIQLAHIEPGQLVLDAATGIGEPALSVATVVGPEGMVVAIDHSDDMLDLARQRASDRGITQIRFQKMDLNQPHFAAQNFHAVLCRWGLMFVDDLQNCLRSLRATLTPGGYCAAAVWGPPDKVPALSLAARVLAEAYGEDWLDGPTRSTFSLQNSEELANHFAQAGFSDLQGQWVPVLYRFQSVRDFLAFRLDCSSTFKESFEALSTTRRAEAEALIIRATRAYENSDGALLFENWAYCLAGRRSGDEAET